MKVAEFIKLDKANTIYRVVNANKVGYLTCPEVLFEADRNVVKERVGVFELVGFSPLKKNMIEIYITDKEGANQ